MFPFILALLTAGLPGAANGATVTLSSDTSAVESGGTIYFTVTVSPDTYVDQVALSYQGITGQDIDTTSPYEFSRRFDDCQLDLTVTATVSYTNADPDDQDQIDVDVVDLKLYGVSTATRGAYASFMAESLPAGQAIADFSWSYSWGAGQNNFYDPDTDDDDRSIWAGYLVVAGPVTCTATVAGVSVGVNWPLTLTARNWETPITCAQDNESAWGDVPTPTASLGQHRDKDSDVGSYVFVPRDGSNDWSSAVTLTQVSGGPCDGWWYVSSTTLKCERETVINRYIKSGGPTLGGKNFHAVNGPSEKDCFTTDPDDFIQAVKNHEYRGTPETEKSIEGHHGRMEKSIRDDDRDARQHIESLTATSQALLLSNVNVTIGQQEDAINDYAGDDTYMFTYGPNWGADPGALGDGWNARWNSVGSYWTDCVNGPLDF
jgi:hypothetical protein